MNGITSSTLPATERLRWFRFAAPQTFYPVIGRILPWAVGLSVLLAVAGLAVGLLIAPTDFQQGDAYRIIFVHVPAAWMSMLIYVVMAGWAGMGLVLNTRLSSMMATALAPTGALMTFIALWTGALWGKPTWGAWWVWDARLTSELLLLFLYLGFMALQGAIEDPRRADRAGAIIALVGVVNVPIIYYSVQWWKHAAPRLVGQRHARSQHGQRDAAGHAADGRRLLGLFDRRCAAPPALDHSRT